MIFGGGALTALAVEEACVPFNTGGADCITGGAVLETLGASPRLARGGSRPISRADLGSSRCGFFSGPRSALPGSVSVSTGAFNLSPHSSCCFFAAISSGVKAAIGVPSAFTHLAPTILP